jgi:hypothetical protein
MALGLPGRDLSGFAAGRDLSGFAAGRDLSGFAVGRSLPQARVHLRTAGSGGGTAAGLAVQVALAHSAEQMGPEAGLAVYEVAEADNAAAGHSAA